MGRRLKVCSGQEENGCHTVGRLREDHIRRMILCNVFNSFRISSSSRDRCSDYPASPELQ